MLDDALAQPLDRLEFAASQVFDLRGQMIEVERQVRAASRRRASVWAGAQA